ncbi:unnamed protein product [Amoebophrya sp. A120]|nr:unnamed protein product [Amoebophrya sp. A120]|eukprot:GSA120T00002510001.1
MRIQSGMKNFAKSAGAVSCRLMLICRCACVSVNKAVKILAFDANGTAEISSTFLLDRTGAPLVEFFSTDKRWPSCDMCPSCWAKGLCDGKSVGGAANADDHVNAALFKAQFNETEILRFLADVYS